VTTQTWAVPSRTWPGRYTLVVGIHDGPRYEETVISGPITAGDALETLRAIKEHRG